MSNNSYEPDYIGMVKLAHDGRLRQEIFLIFLAWTRLEWGNKCYLILPHFVFTNFEAMAKRTRKQTQAENMGLLAPLVLTCTLHFLHFGRDQISTKSTQVFLRLASRPKSTQVEWRPLTYYYPMNTGYVCLEMDFLRLACTSEETRKSDWSPNASLNATCDPFGQGFNVQPDI